MLKNFSDITYDHSLLRHRTSDKTIFSVCKKELTEISAEINQLFSDMAQVLNKKRYHIDVTGLNKHIESLEETYQHILQVTSREPLVFLLFLSSLKALSNEMAKFFEIEKVLNL